MTTPLQVFIVSLKDGGPLPKDRQECFIYVRAGHTEPHWRAGYFYAPRHSLIERDTYESNIGRSWPINEVTHWMPAPCLSASKHF